MKPVFLLGCGFLVSVVLLWLWAWFCRWKRHRGLVYMANSLPLQRCREIIGSDCTLSDAALELLRDQFYGLADVATRAFVETRRGNGSQTAPEAEIRAFVGGDGVGHVQEPVGFQGAIQLLPEDERSDLEERAAVHEFEGGLDRDAAERAAFCDYWRQKHGRHDDCGV